MYVHKFFVICVYANFVNDTGDEFHYLHCYPNFIEERKIFFNLKYDIRPSTFYLHKLSKKY